MAVRGEVVLQAVRELCPPRYSLEGDKTGLQVGRSDKLVNRVLCTLDLTLAVAEEAKAAGAELIVSHHAVRPGSGGEEAAVGEAPTPIAGKQAHGRAPPVA